jgi:nucleoside-diphosphate-sugar epimerase
MRRVLVTGADGFTGRHLVPLLSAAGCEVHGLVQQKPERPVAGLAAVHVADLQAPAEVERAVAAASPHRAVHLAGIAFVADRNVTQMYGVNLVGSRNLLEALARLPTTPESVLLASSANVYGNARQAVIDESVAPAPANDYAVSKLAMEFAARLFVDRLPTIVCRPFNYTGVGQSESFLLPKIVAHVRRRIATLELGNIDVARDFSDVRDVCAAYVRLLETPAAIGETVNLCSGTAHSLREVLAMVEAISSFPLTVRINPAFVRANEVRSLRGSRARLEALLPGLAAPIPLADTLRWMIEDRDPLTAA